MSVGQVTMGLRDEGKKVLEIRSSPLEAQASDPERGKNACRRGDLAERYGNEHVRYTICALAIRGAECESRGGEVLSSRVKFCSGKVAPLAQPGEARTTFRLAFGTRLWVETLEAGTWNITTPSLDEPQEPDKSELRIESATSPPPT